METLEKIGTGFWWGLSSPRRSNCDLCLRNSLTFLSYRYKYPGYTWSPYAPGVLMTLVTPKALELQPFSLRSSSIFTLQIYRFGRHKHYFLFWDLMRLVRPEALRWHRFSLRFLSIFTLQIYIAGGHQHFFLLEMQSYCACIPLRSGIPHHQWTQCISALSLSHQPASQLYPSSHLLRVSSLFNILAVLYLELRLCFNPQTAQALSQVSDRSGRVSSFRSCFDFKPRFVASRSIMRQLEEWDVFR